MLAILKSLNAHNLPIFQPILMILVSKFMVRRALSDKKILIIRVAVPFKYYHFFLHRKQCVHSVVRYRHDFDFSSDIHMYDASVLLI